MAFCAMVKAAGCGSVAGRALPDTNAETARAAAEDGLFARVFARVDQRGVPIGGLIVVGVLMTGMGMFALAPSLGGLFGRLVSMSTLLIIPAYLFSAVALSLDKTESNSMRFVGMAAAVVTICIAAAAEPSDALLALVLVLATAPLFIVNQRSSASAKPQTVLDYRGPAPKA